MKIINIDRSINIRDISDWGIPYDMRKELEKRLDKYISKDLESYDICIDNVKQKVKERLENSIAQKLSDDIYHSILSSDDYKKFKDNLISQLAETLTNKDKYDKVLDNFYYREIKGILKGNTNE